MAIGRTEDRDTPRDPTMLRHHGNVRDPIRETHLGQRSIRPRTQAGHMTAIDQYHHRRKSLARPGAVHIWVPACAGMTLVGKRTMLSQKQVEQYRHDGY